MIDACVYPGHLGEICCQCSMKYVIMKNSCTTMRDKYEEIRE